MVNQRGSIQFIRFLLQSFVQAKYVTSQIRHLSLSTSVFPKFLTNFFLLCFLSQKFQTFQKHGMALLISINQYCHTVPFLIFGVVNSLVIGTIKGTFQFRH